MEFLSIFVSIFFNQTIKIKGPAILIFLSLPPIFFSSPYSYHHLFSSNPNFILFSPFLVEFYIYSFFSLASFLSSISFVFIPTPPPSLFASSFHLKLILSFSSFSLLYLHCFSSPAPLFYSFFFSLYFSIMKDSSLHLASLPDFLTNSAIFFLCG